MSLKVAALAVAATALLSATSAVAGTNDCTFQSPYGATFDITPLQNVAALNQGVIKTTGGDVPCTETVEQNYTVSLTRCVVGSARTPALECWTIRNNERT